MDTQLIIEELISSVPVLQAIYLFGSEVTSEKHSASDLDLAVLSAETLDEMMLWSTGQSLAAKIKQDVDLVDFEKASTVMQMQIVSTGELIFCTDEKRIDRLEDYVYSAYARLNQERRGILEDIQKRGTVYG